MTQITYPSPEFPAQPGFTIDSPEGWEPLVNAALPLAIGAVVAPQSFRPNVIAVITRLRPETTFDEAITQVVTQLERSPGFTEIGREHLTISGFPGFRIEAAFSSPAVGALTQAVRVALVPRGPVNDLVQLTATCDAEQAKTMWPEIRRIQDSLQIIA